MKKNYVKLIVVAMGLSLYTSSIAANMESVEERQDHFAKLKVAYDGMSKSDQAKFRKTALDELYTELSKLSNNADAKSIVTKQTIARTSLDTFTVTMTINPKLIPADREALYASAFYIDLKPILCNEPVFGQHMFKTLNGTMVYTAIRQNGSKIFSHKINKASCAS